MKRAHLLSALVLSAFAAGASAQSYTIEPNHTYPSFEAPHLGISLWRGKFNKTAGKINLDRAARTGTIDIVIDTASVDFGHQKMNEHARGKDFFNAEQFPQITYKGRITKFNGDAPSEVQGDLTMLGVTKPVTLTLNSFKCIDHPMLKREVCGADVAGAFNRRDFGMTYAAPVEAAGAVKLAIQVEALRDN